MNPSETPRAFMYHAHGFAVSGVIATKDGQDFIPTQAMATLPTTGGLADVTVEDFSHKGIVSFKKANTHITGVCTAPNVYETDMKATIEGLNILDRFTAEKVVTHIHCKHTLGAFGHEKDDIAEIVPGDSDIVGAQIDGCPVTIGIDHQLFSQYANYQLLKDDYNNKPDLRDKLKRQFNWVPGQSKQDIPEPVKTRYKWAERFANKIPESGHLLCTLVNKVEGQNLDGRVFGNIIVLPNFGTIYLADFFVKNHERRLEMVRIDLNCNVVGTIVDGGNGNGSGFPPSGT